MEGQQDESTFQSPQQLYFQPLPENALYSTVATTVHVPQTNTVKWTINTIQVRYHVRANHCSYTKITISCKKNIYIYIYIYMIHNAYKQSVECGASKHSDMEGISLP
jgi:hypothetical protein